MRRRHALGSVLALLAALAVGGPARAQAPAQPQAPVIIIVDFQAVLRDAAASRAVEEQIDGMRADLQNEFSEIEQELRSVELELTEGRSEMSEEEFLQRRREFERRVSDAQERAQASRAALDAAFDTAMGSVRAALLQVIATLAEQAGATIVLNKNQVILADLSLDLTEEALALLNERLPTVEVVVDRP